MYKIKELKYNELSPFFCKTIIKFSINLGGGGGGGDTYLLSSMQKTLAKRLPYGIGEF